MNLPPEHDLEYLPLFSRALPLAEAQYGDFIRTPEAVNWPEIESDACRLLARSKDIRILIPLLRCRTQLAGAQGLAETITLLENLRGTYSHTLHPQLLPVKTLPQKTPCWNACRSSVSGLRRMNPAAQPFPCYAKLSN